jgi:hypothetical protein
MLMFQVGLTDKGSVFVILGSGRIQPETFAEFTPKELKKCKVRCGCIYKYCNETFFTHCKFRNLHLLPWRRMIQLGGALRRSFMQLTQWWTVSTVITDAQ